MERTARPYQNECCVNLRMDFARGYNRLAIVLPTGAGKGFVLGMCVIRFHKTRTVILANREELMEQIEATVREMRPDLTVGWVKAERNEYDADVVIASVNSMSPQRCEQFSDVDLVMADECHYSIAKSWMSVFAHFGCFEPAGTKTIGFTATMIRNDELGLGDLWQKVSFQRDLAWAIKNKFVVPDNRIDIAMPSLDLRDAKRNEDGEYDEADVGNALVHSGAGRELASIFKRHAGDRRGILFVPTKRAAHAVAGDFTAAGVSNAVITGETPRVERRRIYAAARRGEYQVMINVGVLIAGFDDPGISVVMIATMTKAQSRLTQMAGRGMRLDPNWPGKPDCLVLIVKGVEAEIATVVELKRTGAPRPTAGPARATKRKAKAPAYAARMVGPRLVVTCDGVVIYRKACDRSEASATARYVTEQHRLTSS